jgi:hypothetical protein
MNSFDATARTPEGDDRGWPLDASLMNATVMRAGLQPPRPPMRSGLHR